MRTLNYIMTCCLLFMASQLLNAQECDSGFLSLNITPVSCNGSDGAIDITLTGGEGPFTFTWWTAPVGYFATTEDVDGITVGGYNLNITDASGADCYKHIKVKDAIVCEANITETSCNPDGALDISCTGGTAPYTYLWSNGATTEDLNNILADYYRVTITDANGCNSEDWFLVDVNSNFLCDTLYVNPVQVTVGNQIQVDYQASNFVEMRRIAYTVHYDPTILQLDSIGNLTSEMSMWGYWRFDTTNPGTITCSWEIGDVIGFIPDELTMYSLFFTPLSTENSDLYIDGNPLPVEVLSTNSVTSYAVEDYLESPTTTILVDGNILSGNIYHDANNNCQNDNEVTLPYWNMVDITNGINTWNLTTDASGYYFAVVADGTYEIEVTSSNENWGVCNNNVTVDVTEFVTQDFGSLPLNDCSELEVDLAIPRLIRCFENQLYINYCNYGTTTATNTYIELALDPAMIFVSASIAPSSVNGNLLTFDVGDVALAECSDIVATILLDENCDITVLDQTHCTTATIYPHTSCGDVDPLWGGANLELTGNCDGENVNFVIENVGTGNMDLPSSFIVIEDNTHLQITPEDFMLSAGESLTITKPANGSTYYMSVDQVAYHPGKSQPSLAVEGCGENANGDISLGVVTQYNQNDNDGFVDIECVQNVGSYDPNDKAAMLKGFGAENNIYANTPMEYMIRFQNTGTFTAFNVVVEDELSPNFDITSLRPGASSHDYTFSIKDGRTMVFTFENINLPDSTADLAGSNGFLSYKVNQLLDLQDGTVLKNTADIYFDFNEAIVTNTTSHTIGSDFIITSTSFDNELNIENAISIYPNPSTENITFELDQIEDKLSLEVYDLTGRLIYNNEFSNEKIILSKNDLEEGMYFYSILSKGKQVESGKFVFL